MSSKADCLNCAIRGYSPEVCALHLRMAKGGEDMDATTKTCGSCAQGNSRNHLGKTLAAGACVGMVASVAGLGAAVAVGVKGVIETVLAAKLVAGMGIAGAATSAAIKNKADKQDGKGNGHLGYSVPILYVKEE
ncbi:hypothetical protein [Fundidesulfovibrio magnetotacticus]|uniref:hypothetical protein n=1 Tax=Fundidesulfovibrio magnetotacticus TaxID=2730080 RepID=UPI00156674D6|nr:hypothetical protein [Fundidesulfovibrio magnetotacticus]